jgi:hypothetical protein
MHAAISSLDSANPKRLATALGYMRSAWEDIHQSRRQAFAGRQRTKLDSRPDDNRTRLLTKDEEKEVEKGRMSKQKQHWGKEKVMEKVAQIGMPHTHCPSGNQGRVEREKENARAERNNKRSDGARVHIRPPDPCRTQGHNVQESPLKLALERNEKECPVCPFQGPQERIEHWEEITNDRILLQAIRKGAKAPLSAIPMPNNETCPPCPVQESLTKTIGEYLETRAIRKLSPEEAEKTRYWTPIFGREKRDSKKVRMITDMRDLNSCHEIQNHKPQTWVQLQNTLQDKSLQWAITLDLQGYYHHMKIHPHTARWMRFRYGDEAFQVQGMPFGWSMAPFWAHRLAKPIRKQMHNWNILHGWWVDDIIIFGKTKGEKSSRAA